METSEKNYTILFVEDDTQIAGLYQARMEMEGFTVTLCEDGEKALQEAKNLRPDLILLDLMVPKIGGFELLETFRSLDETKQAKIIILSAIGETSEVDRAKKLGADDYIVKSQKPISDVLEHIKSALGVQAEGPAESASS